MFRADLPAVRWWLDGWQWTVAVDSPDGRWAALANGDTPSLPWFQVRAARSEGDPTTLEFFLNDATAGTWQFRRQPATTLPVARLIGRSADGTPYLVPEVQLLYKAKPNRPKDRADLAACLPRLPEPRRAWLRAALAAWRADHPWLARI